jgi:hypothetical protein
LAVCPLRADRGPNAVEYAEIMSYIECVTR